MYFLGPIIIIFNLKLQAFVMALRCEDFISLYGRVIDWSFLCLNEKVNLMNNKTFLRWCLYQLHQDGGGLSPSVRYNRWFYGLIGEFSWLFIIFKELDSDNVTYDDEYEGDGRGEDSGRR